MILRSLKKAAPLLVHVAFLISFFWLLFAIIGVQSFKSSLRRNCVWIDPAGQQNFTNDNQFCGGYLDNVTGQPMPYRTIHNQNGTKTHKGFLCPQGSMCIEGENPFSGTQSFDNIFQSLELVFVIMSTNTYTDLLYKVADSDYLAGALCKTSHIFFRTSVNANSFRCWSCYYEFVVNQLGNTQKGLTSQKGC